MTLVNKENTQESARTTVLQSDDIEQDIRHLVVQTLNEGKFSPEAIKQTLQDVLTGATEGASQQLEKNTEALEQVVSGIDAALSQVAGASKLAIEEASSNLQDFSDHDLKRALTDLQDLESLFLDTLSDVANKGQETTKATLTRLLEHLQNSGSSVGDSVTKILSALHHDLSKGGRLEKIQAAEMAKTASVSFIRMASGMLAGIADSLENKK
jgi:DNA-binding protein YbaB